MNIGRAHREVKSKSPTSRKGREKWGTQVYLKDRSNADVGPPRSKSTASGRFDRRGGGG